MKNKHNKFVVRLWDKYDGWIDCTNPLSKKDAKKRWNKETKNGTVYAEQDYDKQYYRIFPANTQMLYTPEYFGK